MTATNKTLTWLGALAMILLFTLAAGQSHAAGELQSVSASAGFAAKRGDSERLDLGPPQPLAGQERPAGATATKGDGHGTAAPGIVCCSHYVYSGFTELFDDRDYDGYYSYLRINVDIDTDYAESHLYLKAFLRGSLGGWQKIYTSNVFTIHGTSSFDDYEIETELISGFVPDQYDALVEVYDADSGQLVAEYGPLENSAFGLLPLEDANRDGAITSPIVNSYGSSGGGSLSWAALFLLATLALYRRLRPGIAMQRESV